MAPILVTREENNSASAFFVREGILQSLGQEGADNCHSKASATQRMSLTKENVVDSLFWVLAGEQLSEPGSQKARSRNYQRRGLRLRRALSGRTGRGRIPETALSITSFRRIRGSLPKRRTLVLGFAGSCACKFVGRDVGVLVAVLGFAPKALCCHLLSQVSY